MLCLKVRGIQYKSGYSLIVLWKYLSWRGILTDNNMTHCVFKAQKQYQKGVLQFFFFSFTCSYIPQITATKKHTLASNLVTWAKILGKQMACQHFPQLMSNFILDWHFSLKKFQSTFSNLFFHAEILIFQIHSCLSSYEYLQPSVLWKKKALNFLQ